MKTKNLRKLLLVLVFFLFATSNIYAAPPNVISPDELFRGMKGIGRTVIQGTQIEEFDAEVIGVMKNSGSTGGDLILVRVSGDVIDRSGGVAQGMSGSPVFFNGRLAGAVAFGWSLSDPDICMLTPIGEMLKISEDMRQDLADQARKREQSLQEDTFGWVSLLSEDKDRNEKEEEDDTFLSESEMQLSWDEITEEGIEEIPEEDAGVNIAEEIYSEETTFLRALAKGTPIMAVGFSERGLAMLKENLQDLEVVPYAVGAAPYGMDSVELEPGSAVSVEVIRGDVSLGVLGTVTWVDGDEILAFGHPFTKRGKVNYFLSNAYTFTTVSSINSPFKVGAPGKLLGAALQDRGSGVAGKLAYYPEIIPMLITVNDTARNVTKVHAVQILQNEILSPYLAQAAAVSLVERTVDRVGEGSARVKFTIRAQDMPEGKEIRRDNMFYSVSSVSDVLASEMASGIQLLKRNRFAPLTIIDVSINVDISDTRDTATILSARPLVKAARPGDVVGIEVTLQPFQGENVKRLAHFTVPKDQKAGSLALSVRGGTSLVTLQSVVNQQNAAEMAVLLREDQSKYKSFAEEIEDFNKRDRNNDIVVDLFPQANVQASKKKNNNVGEQLREQEAQISQFVQGSRYKTNTQIPYIVTGETTTVLEIVLPGEN